MYFCVSLRVPPNARAHATPRGTCTAEGRYSMALRYLHCAAISQQLLKYLHNPPFHLNPRRHPSCRTGHKKGAACPPLHRRSELPTRRKMSRPQTADPASTAIAVPFTFQSRLTEKLGAGVSCNHTDCSSLELCALFGDKLVCHCMNHPCCNTDIVPPTTRYSMSGE